MTFRVLLAGLGRFALRISCSGCTAEFGYLRFGDGFVQTSSIMPQKRNPVAIQACPGAGQQGVRCRLRRF